MAKVIPPKVWVQDELVTVAQLNQVAENADPRTDYTPQTNFNSAINLSATTNFNTPIWIAHTTRTGRVKVTVLITVSNTTGATFTYEYTVMHGATSAPATNLTGSATNGITSESTANNQISSINVFGIVTGLTPGTVWYFGLGSRRTAAGAAGVVTRYTIIAEDF